jgi:hypothetical protein
VVRNRSQQLPCSRSSYLQIRVKNKFQRFWSNCSAMIIENQQIWKQMARTVFKEATNFIEAMWRKLLEIG